MKKLTEQPDKIYMIVEEPQCINSSSLNHDNDDNDTEHEQLKEQTQVLHNCGGAPVHSFILTES